MRIAKINNTNAIKGGTVSGLWDSITNPISGIYGSVLSCQPEVDTSSHGPGEGEQETGV